MSPRATTAICLLSVAVLFAVFWIVGQFDVFQLSQEWVEGILKVLVWVVPSVLVTFFMWGRSAGGALEELGLRSNPVTGYAFGLAAAVPTLIAWPAVGARPLFASAIVGSVLLGPLAEEVLFRGLLFRQLYRRGGQRPLRAMTVSALAFGFAHLANVDFASVRFAFQNVRFAASQTMTPVIGQVGLTALGGLLFAWVAYRWDSLWPAIGLHTFMNLSWEVFGVNGPTGAARGALGLPADAATTTRLASVAIAVYLTWRLTRRRRTGRVADPVT
jgi:membrane protease YdiL (CAAX protease family)